MFASGVGRNGNQTLGARAFLLASWSKNMSNYVAPGKVSAVSAATVLSGGQKPALLDMFIGNMGGCIGEVSTIALLIGAAYLVFRKVISLRIPAVYILTTAILLMVFNKSVDGILEQLLSGGLMLGAFFMATDYTTSPVTKKGEIIFAFGCGLITSLIRVFGGYPEGVSYSILLMNLLVPLIDSKTMPKVFGVANKGAKDE